MFYSALRSQPSQPVKQCYSRGDSSRVVHMSVCRPDRHHHQWRVLIMSLYLLLSSSGTPFTNVFGLFSFLPNPILTAGWMAHSISLLSNPSHVDYRSVERSSGSSSRQDRSLAICCCPSPQDSIYLPTAKLLFTYLSIMVIDCDFSDGCVFKM